MFTEKQLLLIRSMSIVTYKEILKYCTECISTKCRNCDKMDLRVDLQFIKAMCEYKLGGK